jgi:hypothetical protein
VVAAAASAIADAPAPIPVAATRSADLALSEMPDAAAEDGRLIRRPSAAVGIPPAKPGNAAAASDAGMQGQGPWLYGTVVDGGRAVLYRTRDGYALARTGLGRAASGTADLARRTAAWLRAKSPGL